MIKENFKTIQEVIKLKITTITIENLIKATRLVKAQNYREVPKTFRTLSTIFSPKHTLSHLISRFTPKLYLSRKLISLKRKHSKNDFQRRTRSKN
jgi:hypothetical protein